jgi:hypothetical protein
MDNSNRGNDPPKGSNIDGSFGEAKVGGDSIEHAFPQMLSPRQEKRRKLSDEKDNFFAGGDKPSERE